MGLVKLWWSNRAIRRLEIIDEEKRARISLMSRCGIENMRAPGIPFGVRAILSGVEVEGIWISRPNSPGPCQLTPVATQVGRRIRIAKGKGKMIVTHHLQRHLSRMALFRQRASRASKNMSVQLVH
jgi:hypothetical protein